jgi:hypothetical protein
LHENQRLANGKGVFFVRFLENGERIIVEIETEGDKANKHSNFKLTDEETTEPIRNATKNLSYNIRDINQ